MRRFLLAIVVGLLTLSASGASSLVAQEPCTGYELAGEDDGTCAPTCVTCGCCAQSVEPVMIGAANSPDAPTINVITVPPQFPHTEPRDIVHVPKHHLA